MVQNGQPVPHHHYTSEKDIPFQHESYLGNGAFGYVDKVTTRGNASQEYARKITKLTFHGHESEVAAIEDEIRMIRRISHQHVIKVICTYRWDMQYAMILEPVAEADLEAFLAHTDLVSAGSERNSLMEQMQPWAGCLVQAIDYLHEMRIKHKDIKPSNILITEGKVCITDFGIAHDLLHEHTTASVGSVGPHTPLYCAPEVLFEVGRRGRAADIFSLGCVFLEISTIFMAGTGALRRFYQHRQDSRHLHNYARCPDQILQWIWHLWGHWSDYTVIHNPIPYNDFMYHGPAPCDLAFLMLDPDPKTRITSRQLVSLIESKRFHFLAGINNKACTSCRRRTSRNESNLPYHSVYKSTDCLEYPTTPDAALTVQVAPSWEAAKRLWLQYHMWW